MNREYAERSHYYHTVIDQGKWTFFGRALQNYWFLAKVLKLWMQLRQELIYSVGYLTFLAFLALVWEILFPSTVPSFWLSNSLMIQCKVEQWFTKKLRMPFLQDQWGCWYVPQLQKGIKPVSLPHCPSGWIFASELLVKGGWSQWS